MHSNAAPRKRGQFSSVIRGACLPWLRARLIKKNTQENRTRHQPRERTRYQSATTSTGAAKKVFKTALDAPQVRHRVHRGRKEKKKKKKAHVEATQWPNLARDSSCSVLTVCGWVGRRASARQSPSARQPGRPKNRVNRGGEERAFELHAMQVGRRQCGKRAAHKWPKLVGVAIPPPRCWHSASLLASGVGQCPSARQSPLPRQPGRPKNHVNRGHSGRAEAPRLSAPPRQPRQEGKEKNGKKMPALKPRTVTENGRRLSPMFVHNDLSV